MNLYLKSWVIKGDKSLKFLKIQQLFLIIYKSILMEKPERLVALDVFRGLTIALMVVVNNPGSWEYVYAPLEHSKWNGCTPTDLVFPFFMFIMGSAMWYSFKAYDYKLSRTAVIKILRRTLIIFGIGLAVNIYASFSLDIDHLRIMGVMNRIALGYGISAFIILGLRGRYIPWVATVILFGYWAILVIFGGDSPFTLEGNFAGKFDRFFLGANHLQGYEGVAFDQTGLLATLPSVAGVLIGFLTGRIIEGHVNRIYAVKKLLIYGFSGTIAGIIWGIVFPINKLLWSSSYVIYTSGLAMMLLGVFLWSIDLKGYKKWIQPLLVFGMNSLFLYVFSVFLAISLRITITQTPTGEAVALKAWLYSQIFQPLAGNINGSLLYALSFGVFCWLVGWILYRKRIFIKI